MSKKNVMKKYMVWMIWSVFLSSASAEWVSLFNGKDFEGWGGKGATQQNGYRVREGVIESTAQSRNLVTEKEYTDYILEFEFQLTAGANNGLGIHYPGAGDAAYEGMELQILDNTAEKYAELKDYQYHGSLYSLAPAERGHLKPVGEWNTQRVTVRGDRVSVELNAVCILDANLAELAEAHPQHQGVKRRVGKLSFCGHGDVVRWRKLRIAELNVAPTQEEAWYQPSGQEDRALKEKGFVPLFDGHTLTGWKGDSDAWIPKNGWILSYNGKSKRKEKNLWTKESFRDFVLVCDWRWSGSGPKRERPVLLPNGLEKKDGEGKSVTREIVEVDSGIFLRGNPRTQVNMWNWPVGSGEVYGIRTQEALPLPVRAAVTPRTFADRPLGEWNRFVIEMKGERLTVFLNGKGVLAEAVLPGVQEKGPLALQHHGSAIEFANLYVKEL